MIEDDLAVRDLLSRAVAGNVDPMAMAHVERKVRSQRALSAAATGAGLVVLIAAVTVAVGSKGSLPAGPTSPLQAANSPAGGSVVSAGRLWAWWPVAGVAVAAVIALWALARPRQARVVAVISSVAAVVTVVGGIVAASWLEIGWEQAQSRTSASPSHWWIWLALAGTAVTAAGIGVRDLVRGQNLSVARLAGGSLAVVSASFTGIAAIVLTEVSRVFFSAPASGLYGARLRNLLTELIALSAVGLICALLGVWWLSRADAGRDVGTRRGWRNVGAVAALIGTAMTGFGIGVVEDLLRGTRWPDGPALPLVLSSIGLAICLVGWAVWAGPLFRRAQRLGVAAAMTVGSVASCVVAVSAVRALQTLLLRAASSVEFAESRRVLLGTAAAFLLAVAAFLVVDRLTARGQPSEYLES
jgi:hypothetical protein